LDEEQEHEGGASRALVPIDQQTLLFYGKPMVVVRLAAGRAGAVLRWFCENLQHQALPHFLCFRRHLLFEWFAPSFIISDLAQRFAVLLTFPDGPSRVAEGKDREDRDVLGNAQQGIDLRQVVKANPV
jgi:hypothetical protein